MKTKIIIIALIFSNIVAKAQTPDTLFINVGDYAQLCISSMDIFRVHKKTESADILFKSFYYDYLSSKTKIGSGKNVDVFHKMEDGISKITIKERNDITKEVYIQDEKVQKLKSYPIKIHFLNHYPPYEKLTLYVKDEKYFPEIAKVSLDSLRQTIDVFLKKSSKRKNFMKKASKKRIFNKNYSYKLMFDSNGNKINLEKGIAKRKSNNNYIDVRPMAGIFAAWSELETFGPSVGLDLGLTINRKQFKRYKIGIMANLSVIGNPIVSDSTKYDVVMQHSLYFAINNSRSITNEMRFGLSTILGEHGQGFGPFVQYSIKKIGFKIDMPLSKSEINEIFEFNDGISDLPDEDYCKYNMSFSIFYNF